MTEITHTPGVIGGDACINDTRIGVWLTADCWNQLGNLDAVCARWVWEGGISREDVVAALDYYAQHRDEIDQDIADEERARARLMAAQER